MSRPTPERLAQIREVYAQLQREPDTLATEGERQLVLAVGDLLAELDADAALEAAGQVPPSSPEPQPIYRAAAILEDWARRSPVMAEAMLRSVQPVTYDPRSLEARVADLERRVKAFDTHLASLELRRSLSEGGE